MTPSQVPLSIIIGDDFVQQFQILECSVTNPTQLPSGIVSTSPLTLGSATFLTKDLTNCVVASQIRKTISKTEQLLASFTIAMDDTVNGVFSLTLPNAITSAFKIIDGASYAYDVQVTDAAGKITTYIAGDIELVNSQTR
jgi:hypothetical protein